MQNFAIQLSFPDHVEAEESRTALLSTSCSCPVDEDNKERQGNDIDMLLVQAMALSHSPPSAPAALHISWRTQESTLWQASGQLTCLHDSPHEVTNKHFKTGGDGVRQSLMSQACIGCLIRWKT